MFVSRPPWGGSSSAVKTPEGHSRGSRTPSIQFLPVGATKAPPEAGETVSVDAYLMTECPEQSILERLKTHQITELYPFLISSQSRTSRFQITVASCMTFSNSRILRSQIKWIYYEFITDSCIFYGLSTFCPFCASCEVHVPETDQMLKCTYCPPQRMSFVSSRPTFLQSLKSRLQKEKFNALVCKLLFSSVPPKICTSAQNLQM